MNKVLSDERLGAKLRVTKNRCVLFYPLTHVNDRFIIFWCKCFINFIFLLLLEILVFNLSFRGPFRKTRVCKKVSLIKIIIIIIITIMMIIIMIVMWSIYEIIHIWTAVVDETEEWSSQLIFQFKQLERRSLKKSGLQWDSNLWPLRYQCDALPTELWSHTLGARSIYWVHIFLWEVKWCEVYMK